MKLPKLKLETLKLRVAEIIDSLPNKDSCALTHLNPEIPLLEQNRPCDFCKKMFLPKKNGLARFCSPSCNATWWMQFPSHKAKIHTKEAAKKSGEKRKAFLEGGSEEAIRQIERLKNLKPTLMLGVKEKQRNTRMSRGYFKKRSGNGFPPSKQQQFVYDLLGEDWKMEHVVRTGTIGNGNPTHWKIDIANISQKIAIEIDGISHTFPGRSETDHRKNIFLIGKGWTLYRFSNREIDDLMNIGITKEEFLYMISKRNPIRLSQ
jgi:hypothetical protein